MDRATVYAGQIPREVDILNAGKYGVVGVGMLAQAALGTGLVVDGFALVPTSPASLIATLSPGQVYQVENIDATAWSSLAADSRSIVKQGVLLDATALTFAPPATAGYAQSFLVEVQHQDVDTDAKVLPYYNAAAPSQGFAGPGGSGAAQNTNRRSVAVVQVKAGTAATAGTQQPPTPDAGWAPLFIVTLNAGQTTVTAGNISVHPNAPFIPVKLPGVPTAVQAGTWNYAVASGTNSLAAGLSPTPPALVDGLTFGLKCPSANTGPVTLTLNGFGALPVVRKDGAPLQSGDIAVGEIVRLTYSGGVFGFVNFARSESFSTFITNFYSTPATYWRLDSPNVSVPAASLVILSNYANKTATVSAGTTVDQGGGQVTIGPNDGGVYVLSATNAMDQATLEESIYIFLNGSAIATSRSALNAPDSNAMDKSVTCVQRLKPGDVLSAVYFQQNSSNAPRQSLNQTLGHFGGVRVGG